MYQITSLFSLNNPTSPYIKYFLSKKDLMLYSFYWSSYKIQRKFRSNESSFGDHYWKAWDLQVKAEKRYYELNPE